MTFGKAPNYEFPDGRTPIDRLEDIFEDLGITPCEDVDDYANNGPGCVVFDFDFDGNYPARERVWNEIRILKDLYGFKAETTKVGFNLYFPEEEKAVDDSADVVSRALAILRPPSKVWNGLIADSHDTVTIPAPQDRNPDPVLLDNMAQLKHAGWRVETSTVPGALGYTPVAWKVASPRPVKPAKTTAEALAQVLNETPARMNWINNGMPGPGGSLVFEDQDSYTMQQAKCAVSRCRANGWTVETVTGARDAVSFISPAQRAK